MLLTEHISSYQDNLDDAIIYRGSATADDFGSYASKIIEFNKMSKLNYFIIVIVLGKNLHQRNK